MGTYVCPEASRCDAPYSASNLLRIDTYIYPLCVCMNMRGRIYVSEAKHIDFSRRCKPVYKYDIYTYIYIYMGTSLKCIHIQ